MTRDVRLFIPSRIVVAAVATWVFAADASGQATTRSTADSREIASRAISPDPGPTRLLRNPALSATTIAFEYANDIWVAPREGGDARRVTSFQGTETNASFSPNGEWLAFTAQYGGNLDVYVVPAQGGEPRRLTFHPGADGVRGWTPDGSRVVFVSGRTNAPSGLKFWTVGLDADFPQALPMPRAYQGSFSPDGRRFAYRMPSSFDEEWRNYRGGQNRPIWILDMDDHDLEEVRPWDNSEDTQPVWVGQTVYFLSDRDWAVNVWAYDTSAKQLRQVTQYTDFDIKSLGTDGRSLVFEHAGWIHTLNPATGETKQVDIRVRGDFPWLMAQWEDVGNRFTNAQLSATGKRAIFEARGEIFTIPTEKGGDWRNLTQTPGTAERTPAWSPDGKWVSWFSDASGEYRLVIAPQEGVGAKREITIPDPKFYYTPAWSPDSKRILFTDTDLKLWVVDVESSRITHVDTDAWMVPSRTVDPVWSPDSRWIAYAKRLNNLLHAIFVYSIETGEKRQITDGFSDATSPAWDASGKYLYFLAGTDFGLNTGWLDMTSYERPSTRGVYLAVLKASEPSPLLPITSDEKASADTAQSGGNVARPAAGAAAAQGQEAARAGGAARAITVDIDFVGLERRILALPLPERDYRSLMAGVEAQVFYIESPPGAGGRGGGPGGGPVLHRYNVKEREGREFMSGVQFATLSPDRKKLLYRAGQNWGVVDSDKAPPAANAGRLELANVRMRVDPRAEFRQMFDEGWRFQRDYLYVENMHGVDYARTKAMYEPLVEHVAHRSDLNYLLDWMGGEVAVGHSYVNGGDLPDVPSVPVGLLGADLEIANAHYRVAKVYYGESWNPGLRAPLAEPGAEVRAGEYILEVNGVELHAPGNPYRLFEGTANRQTILRVGPNANTQGSRLVTVVPVASEGQLRQRDWIETNRRKVDELSGGRLAYVWLPNTGQGGYTNFNRYYFAQQDKDGAVIDERFNGGGSAADYIVQYMMREPHGYFNNPIGERRPFTSPAAGIWGPKVMIINESAGSGGDLMPYMFRYYEVGPLVGTRTWGGLVGIWDTPPLIDGGSMLAPRGGFFDIDGNWAVENEGVAPDIEVEMTPKEVIAGGDPQLELAVQEALRLLETQAFDRKAEPPPPVRARRPGRGR
ncbi:MAG: PDZ domain-containing protein [Gemmatimonadetes bacterium]|nr:PDZ domain-containing protein [Gemmatimonadota bacterium]